uniref:Uncharacterized protein n=1 Tax=Anopheles atroparvus TaxID=41427 RepID=A0A182ILZ1_ANOAO
MEASVKFDQYSAYLRTLCRVIGFDVLSATWKMNYKSYFSLFLCAQYLWWMIHSTIATEGINEMLKSLSFVGFYFQNTVKLYYTLSKTKTYQAIYNKLKLVIYDGHMGGTGDQKAVILRMITLIHNLVKATSVLYYSAIMLFSLYPAYMYFWMDEKVTIFPLHIPFVSIYSLYGYAFTNMIHIVVAFYGLTGAITSDTAFMMFVLHMVTYVDLFRIECERFERDLMASELREEWRSDAYKAFCQRRMQTVYSYHQDIIAYMDSLKLCYKEICLVQVATSSFSIMLSLFLALTTDWYATYSFTLISVFQLFIFSVLGNVVQVMNDRMNGVILDLPWYMLPDGEQKWFRFMLSRSQIPADIEIRGFGPLNMRTFTAIMQKIYSCFMMMLNFLGEEN